MSFVRPAVVRRVKLLVHGGQIQLFVIFQEAGLLPEKFRIAFPDDFGPGRDPQRFPFPFGEDCLLPGIRLRIPKGIDSGNQGMFSQ